MQNRYTFQGGSEKQFRDVPTEPLPEGDYNFKVLDAQEPYFKDDTQRWVMRLRLGIEPSGHEVFYQPSTARDGTDRDGVKRDAIGDVFLGVNRAPNRAGEDIETGRLIGAQGRCRLKMEKWQGVDRNAVARIYIPKQLSEAVPQRQSYSPDEVAKAQAEQRKRSADPELEPEQEDIPF